MAEADEANAQRRQREEQEKAEQARKHEDALVRTVAASVGDLFSKDAIREALKEENWSADRASDRLFNQRDAVDEPVKPALNMQKLLAASRAGISRKKPEFDEVEPTL